MGGGDKWLTWLTGERRRREKYTNVLKGLPHEITYESCDD
jgi:hypothetical protein